MLFILFDNISPNKGLEMAGIFQKKIIIGSVAGFIASAIGITAVFFPSLFNLEKKTIDEYSITLSNCSDAHKLFDFLKDHQGKVVKLNIQYCEGDNIYYDEEIKNFYRSAKPGEEYPDRPDQFNETNPNIKKAIATFGDSKLFSVISDYRADYHGEWMYRENGGLGVWCRDKDTNINTGKNNDFSYQILIPYPSNGNKIYNWGFGSDDHKYKEDNSYLCAMEHLSGTFFVNKLIGAHEYGLKESVMHPKYEVEMQGFYGEWMAAPELFELEPLTEKDLQLRNY